MPQESGRNPSGGSYRTFEHSRRENHQLLLLRRSIGFCLGQQNGWRISAGLWHLRRAPVGAKGKAAGTGKGCQGSSRGARAVAGTQGVSSAHPDQGIWQAAQGKADEGQETEETQKPVSKDDVRGL